MALQTGIPPLSLQVKKQWDKLLQEHNCHPGQGFVLLLVQMPLFVMMTMALRNMATTEPLQTAGEETASSPVPFESSPI